MDADDVALPQRLERQVGAARSGPGPRVHRGRLRGDRCQGPADRRRTARSAISRPILAALLSGDSAVCHATAMYRRRAVIAVGAYDASARLAEDYDLWLRLAEAGPTREPPGSRAARAPSRALRERTPARASARAGPAHLCAGQATPRPRRRSRLRLRPWRPLADRYLASAAPARRRRSAWRLGERRTAIALRLRARRRFIPSARGCCASWATSCAAASCGAEPRHERGRADRQRRDARLSGGRLSRRGDREHPRADASGFRADRRRRRLDGRLGRDPRAVREARSPGDRGAPASRGRDPRAQRRPLARAGAARRVHGCRRRVASGSPRAAGLGSDRPARRRAASEAGST